MNKTGNLTWTFQLKLGEFTISAYLKHLNRFLQVPSSNIVCIDVDTLMSKSDNSTGDL